MQAADGDLGDRASIDRAVQGVEVVYHIAATYREAGQPDRAYRAINVDGTRNLLDGARAAGARRAGALQHRRRARSHRQSAGQRGRAVQSRRRLSGHQARSRAAGAAEFGQETGFDVVVARPIGIYGPGDMRFLKMFRGI